MPRCSQWVPTRSHACWLSRQRSGVGGVIAADLDHRLDGVGGSQRSSESGWYAQPGDGQGLGQPFAETGRRAGVGAVQLPCQRLQFRLGHQRVGQVVGATHPLGDGGGHRVGQPVTEVAELVELAALDDRVVEHLGDGAAQRLGAVDHHQDRSGDLKATLAQPNQQVADDSGVLGGALGQGKRDLGAVDGDAEGDHAGVLSHPDAVHHDRDQVQAGQLLSEQLGQGVLGLGDEPARDRRLGGPRSGGRNPGADRLQPAWCGDTTAWRVSAPGRAGPTAQWRRITDSWGTGSSPVPSAARTRGRRTGTRLPPRVTVPCSVRWRTAARSGLWRPLGLTSRVTSSSISRCITCRPVPTAKAAAPRERRLPAQRARR
jgi:hypothetical protein